MIEPVYFLLNHTRKQFWCFENNKSLPKIIEIAVKNIEDWEITDEIFIESECACYGLLPPLVMDKGYKEIMFKMPI
jgi:hypothetical protein